MPKRKIDDFILNGKINAKLRKILHYMRDGNLPDYSLVEISKGSGLTRPTVSHKMRILLERNMVTKTKVIAHTFMYSINKENMENINKFLNDQVL